MLHPGTRHAYQLNAVAAVLWDALQWPQSVPELSALLHEGFPSEDPENLRRQVQSLVASLLDGRLIEEA
ncbi:MAG: PqqD family protein [Candidatus Wallbacteria bacterium]|nr:PqqD family protein [Candidatus Wallbacteria bacterium]